MAGNLSVGMSPMYTAPADKTYVAQPKLIDTTLTAPATETEEKSSSFGTVGVIGTVGAAALCVAGFKKGNVNKKGLARVWDGVCNMTKGVFKGIRSKEVATIRKNGDKNVITIPGQRNEIKTISQLESIGETVDTKASTVFNKSCKLNKGYSYETAVGKVSHKDKNYKVTINTDGTFKIQRSNNQVVNWDNLDNSTQKEIDKFVNSVKEGTCPMNKLERATVKGSNSNGLEYKIDFTNKNGISNGKFAGATSPYHSIESDAAALYRYQNEAANKNINEFLHPTSKKGKTSLNPAEEYYETQVKLHANGNKVKGRFYRENGKLTKFVPEGKEPIVVGNSDYQLIEALNPDIQATLSKNDIWNAIAYRI